MTNKAYIVANEEQERDVLTRLEKEGCSWNDIENTPPTEWHLGRYPYAIFVKDGKKLVWGLTIDVSEVEIIAEDKQDKFKISKEVCDALVEWRDTQSIYASSGRVDEFIDGIDLQYIPDIVNSWWVTPEEPVATNNRLIAIIRWVNGEDVFEVEKPKKWVVRSKKHDNVGDFLYIEINKRSSLEHEVLTFTPENATKFDTREEAESWANAHQEVVEVEA